MAKAFSVTQINNYIKNMFEQDYILSDVTIKGEVSNLKYHTSGHIYFTMKDETGTIAAVMFKGNTYSGLKFRLRDGMKISASGSVKVYERDGKYQIYVKSIVMDGEGDLYKRYIELKNELEEMGMFSAEYKKPIPKMAKRVGIVTAKTGAAIQDIINISKRRNPYIELVLYPALVQGEEAKYSIVKGLETLDSMNMDVIIVGRGGGSIEDLWAFNEEIVARAIFNCNTPIISAVGHETDFTIADFVSDLRAPTPSAAAELAVCDITAITEKLNDYINKLNRGMLISLQNKREEMGRYNLRLSHLNPVNVLDNRRMQLMRYGELLDNRIAGIFYDNRSRLAVCSAKLEGHSPLKKLSQGYSVTTDEKGSPVTTVDNIKNDQLLKINVSDGVIDANVTGVLRFNQKLMEE